MAKFRPGPLVSEIHGSIGGITFSDSRTGQIIRKRCPPKSNHTLSQHAAQLSFGNAARTWRDLSDPLQLAWNRAANSIAGVKSDSALRLTGYQLWMRTYAPAAAAYSISSSAEPTSTSSPPLALALVTAEYDTPSLMASVLALKVFADTVVYALGACSILDGPTTRYNMWRFLGSGLYDDSPLDFISGWYSAFGTPQEYSRGCLRLFTVAPGHPPSTPLMAPFQWLSA